MATHNSQIGTVVTFFGLGRGAEKTGDLRFCFYGYYYF